MLETRDPEQHARHLLADVYKPEGVELWLNSQQLQFDGECPLTLVRDGRHEQVFTAIERLRQGTPS